MINTVRYTILWLTVVGLTCRNASGQIESVGFNFVGGNADFMIDTTPLSAEQVAGFFPQPYWNNGAAWSGVMSRGNGQVPDEIGGVADLVNNLGLPTTMDITWNAENTYNTSPNNTDPPTNAHEQLMDGYLDNSFEQQTVDIQISQIPFDAYDVIVYVGSDANSRTGAVRLNDEQESERWYVTFSASAVFNGAGDYIEATAPTESEAKIANFALFEGIQGSELKIQNVRGSFNSGIHGLQIIQRLAPFILQVDPDSGAAQIVGGDAVAVDMNGYELGSKQSVLLPQQHLTFGRQGLDAIDAGDGDDIPGSSLGESWDLVHSANDSIIEGFLFGGTTVSKDVALPLGRVVDVASLTSLEDLTFSYSLTTGQTIEGLVEFAPVLPPVLPGDYDGNGALTVADIDLQAEAMLSPAPDLATFDENNDGSVDALDRGIWVRDRAGTWFGDANLDGEFNSSDLIVVFSAGEYEDEVTLNSGWAEGDWDGDGDFLSGDLVAAFSDGGYELGPRTAVRAVPEPQTSLVVLLGCVFRARGRREPNPPAASMRT